MSGPSGTAGSPAVSYCTPVSSQASTPLSRDAASPFPADDVVKPRRPAPNELSAEGARWREAGASVVQDLSDVLEHVARSDFALGCHG